MAHYSTLCVWFSSFNISACTRQTVCSLYKSAETHCNNSHQKHGGVGVAVCPVQYRWWMTNFCQMDKIWSFPSDIDRWQTVDKTKLFFFPSHFWTMNHISVKLYFPSQILPFFSYVSYIKLQHGWIFDSDQQKALINFL